MTRRVVGLVIVLAIAWGGLAATIALGFTPRLGLDLQGGTAVVLTAPEGTDPDLIEVSVDIMTRRIEDIGGVQEPDIAISGDNTVVVQLPGVEDEQRAIEAVGQTGDLSFRPVLGIDNDAGLTVKDNINDNAYLLYPDDFRAQVLLVGPAGMVGEDVADAVPVFETQSASWAVSLELTSEGAILFEQMTAEAATYPLGDPRRQIAIVLDGLVISAPQVIPEGGISGGRASISVGTGEDSQQEANDLAVVLRYGSLPVAFEISAVQKISATLGSDSLEAGIIAGLLGLALVAIVLVLIYRSLGLLAIVGLTVFGSLLLMLFGLLGEFQGLTLTLAGITGIIVSIGITTDSYIVFYERLKEKLREGYEVDEAAEEGFRLAYRTILTADTVSLLAAVLLWMLAVGAVKGFALALGLATVLDLIIAKVYTRRAVGILAHTSLGSGGWFSIKGASQ